MRDFQGKMDALKSRDIAPRFNLWLRIEDTLQKRRIWLTRCYSGLALAATTACLALVFVGRSAYNPYPLEDYLSQLFVYTPNPVASEFGTLLLL